MSSSDVPADLNPRVRQIMATAMNVKAIPDSARRGEFEPWDSLGHLLVIDALEANFGIRITPEEAMTLDSIGSIEALLKERGETA